MLRNRERRSEEVSSPRSEDMAGTQYVLTARLDFMHIALDVTANGRLPLPPYPEGNPSAIHSISIFLYSYATGRNFTVTNGTWPLINGSRTSGDIMLQEPDSTVKHVNWMWPDCLVGNGQPRTLGDVRGVYNVCLLCLLLR